MASIINSSNWSGPNAAGMGGTPAPYVADDGTGLHSTQYSGDGTLAKSYAETGPSVAGASPTNSTTATQPLTGKVS
jgi:hypothetical protein